MFVNHTSYFSDDFRFWPLFWPASESGIEKSLKKERKATLMIYKLPSTLTIIPIRFMLRYNGANFVCTTELKNPQPT